MWPWASPLLLLEPRGCARSLSCPSGIWRLTMLKPSKSTPALDALESDSLLASHSFVALGQAFLAVTLGLPGEGCLGACCSPRARHQWRLQAHIWEEHNCPSTQSLAGAGDVGPWPRGFPSLVRFLTPTQCVSAPEMQRGQPSDSPTHSWFSIGALNKPASYPSFWPLPAVSCCFASQ